MRDFMNVKGQYVLARTIGIQIPEEQSSEKLTLEDSMLLRGKTASPDQYEGIAHVVLKPSVDIELKPSEILVVPYLILPGHPSSLC